MSNIEKLIIESIDNEFAAILSEGKDCDEDDNDDKKEKSDDKDDEDDEDDSGKKEEMKECDCDDDDEEDEVNEGKKKSMKEGYDFASVTTSPADAATLKKLFSEIDAKEQADLWKEVQKSPEDCQKIVKYAKTII